MSLRHLEAATCAGNAQAKCWSNTAWTVCCAVHAHRITRHGFFLPSDIQAHAHKREYTLRARAFS